MSNETEFDVGIVGLGPVGCTAALFLADAGLSVVAIERDEEVYRLPRAVNLDGEIIRAFQRIGRAQAVDSLMQTVRPGDRGGFANSKREWLFGNDFAAFGSNGWQPTNMFDQPEFEQYLRGEVLDHPGITSFVGHEASDIVNHDHGVNVTLQPANLAPATESASSVVGVRYLIGCDGASSFVRKHFAIDWTDLGYDHEWLVVDVTTNEKHTLDNSTVQVCDPDRIHTYVCTKDPYRRWEFKLNPGETREQMLAPETISSLIDSWTPRNSYEIRRAAVYQFHAATADNWRVDNVFIAGDAAHQTPPFLGQGMNAGMRDVINIAWKLPLVINGHCSDELLDSYQAERNAHAHDLVEWAVSIGRLMEHRAQVEKATREGKPSPPTPAALQSSGYGQGREQPPIRDGVIQLTQVNDSGSAGYLFSQPDLDQDGITIKMDKLLGDGFALVTNKSNLELSEASAKILKKIDARVVDIRALKTTRGHIDRLFQHYDSAIVRPDRLVFGHTDKNTSLNDLIENLANKLALTNL